MKRILKTTLIGAALALALSSPLMAMEVASVAEARQEVARNVATLVNDPAFDKALRGQMSRNKAMLNDVLIDYTSKNATARRDVSDTLHDLDRQAIHLRGLDGALDGLVDLRMSGTGEQPPASTRGTWTGTFVKNRTTGEKELVAYDPSGTEHHYPAGATPAVPMLLVESKNSAATRAGMQVMNEATRREGLQSDARQATAKGAMGPEDLTILTDMYLAHDGEFWLLMDADVYAVVSGVGPDGKAEVVFEPMPWLDHKGIWYNPQKKPLVQWGNFGANYVTVQIYEDDGDTNFQEIASKVIGAVGDLSLLVAPAAPQAIIASGLSKIANEIVKVMPGKWFTNSPDYIDTFYMIEPGTHATREKPLIGARGWAKMAVRPYVAGADRLKAVVDKTGAAKGGMKDR